MECGLRIVMLWLLLWEVVGEDRRLDEPLPEEILKKYIESRVILINYHIVVHTNRRF